MKIERKTKTIPPAKSKAVTSVDSSKSEVIVKNDAEKIPATTSTSEAELNKVSAFYQLTNLAHEELLDKNRDDEYATLEQRTFGREKLKRMKKQKNLEIIMHHAQELAHGDKAGHNVDADWFAQFCEFAENVSNKVMQRLWSKILVKETLRPGSFSIKTLKTFKELSIKEAKILSKACALAVNNSAHNNLRIITGYYEQPRLLNFFRNKSHKLNLASYGLNYSDIMVLANIDLLFASEIESKPLPKGQEMVLMFGNKSTIIKPVHDHCVLNFYKFTPAGSELAKLVHEPTNSEYLTQLSTTLSHDFQVVTQ